MNYDFDLIVIGAGPGGYVSAIRASQLGLKAAVVEKDKPGGVCLNVGCIPSKSLIHNADVFRHISDLQDMGIKVDKSEFNYRKVFKKSRKAADTLSKGVNFLLKKNNIELIQGEARIAGGNSIVLNDGKILSAKNIIIATGSRPRIIPGFEFDEQRVLSSTGALMLEELPKSMMILGAGAIGVEFAHVFSSFGVEIHLVEMMDRILPLEDEETVEVINRSFRKRGIKIYTATKALSLEKAPEELHIVLEGKDGEKKIVSVEKMLVAVGRAPNSENLDLEKAGIKTERGFIPTGDYYVTSSPCIYAIGDVINTPLLAHVASKEGEIAVEHIAGHETPKRIDPNSIPGAVYCEPQIGSFGYTEWKAKQEGIEYAKAVFPYRGAGKSVAIEQPDGMAKVLYNPKTKEIIGASVVGAEATELVHEILLAKTAELLPEDIATMIHAHPTLSESVMEVMRAVEGWAIHA
ncbi:MAG: dihydrolipoyl dehydrogenase [Firmicutes bacterium]|nr:dihydrolipoyl dehydrogenase [Bacillota bacterium]